MEEECKAEARTRTRCGTRQLFPIWKCSVWALVALALLSAVRPHDCHESSPLLASYLSLS